MKKSLIALAVMAAAGAASAQSSVQIYGIADVWFGSAKVTNNWDDYAIRETKVDSGGVNTSRIGIKGSEDLGGGLKANFVLEKAINVDTGSADGGFDRQATVGLASKFGEVTVGRQFSAYDDIRGTANNTFDANVSATATTWVGYTANVSNSIKYTSPSFNGFSGAISYAFGEDKATSVNNSASSVLSLNVQYANGPLFVGFAHQTEKLKTGLGSEGSPFGPALYNMVYNADGDDSWNYSYGDDKVTYNLLTASYDFGVAKLVGSFNKAKYTWGGYSDTDKATEYQIGVEVPLAANLTLGAGYAQSKLKYDGVEYGKSTGFSAALVYALSKRTSLYAALNNSKYKEDGDVALKYQAYAVGVNHKF